MDNKQNEPDGRKIAIDNDMYVVDHVWQDHFLDEIISLFII